MSFFKQLQDNYPMIANRFKTLTNDVDSFIEDAIKYLETNEVEIKIPEEIDIMTVKEDKNKFKTFATIMLLNYAKDFEKKLNKLNISHELIIGPCKKVTSELVQELIYCNPFEGEKTTIDYFEEMNKPMSDLEDLLLTREDMLATLIGIRNERIRMSYLKKAFRRSSKHVKQLINKRNNKLYRQQDKIINEIKTKLLLLNSLIDMNRVTIKMINEEMDNRKNKIKVFEDLMILIAEYSNNSWLFKGRTKVKTIIDLNSGLTTKSDHEDCEQYNCLHCFCDLGFPCSEVCCVPNDHRYKKLPEKNILYGMNIYHDLNNDIYSIIEFINKYNGFIK